MNAPGAQLLLAIQNIPKPIDFVYFPPPFEKPLFLVGAGFGWVFISVNTVCIIPSYTILSTAYEERGNLTHDSCVLISSMETHRSEMWTLQFLKDSDRDFENADRRQSLRRMMVRFGEAPVIIRDRNRKFLPVSG